MSNLAQVSHVVAVAAGKGGVGKSMIAVNLARCLSGKGFKVGLLDADLYGPSARKMLPENTPPLQNLEGKDRIIPAECSGIKCISMAYFLKETDPASVRAPIANGIIKQFIHSVEWGQLDYLILDFPPGTGDIQLTLIQEGELSAAVLVATPQEIALLDVAKACAMFRQMQVPLAGVVENMSFFLAGDVRYHPLGCGGAERFATQNGLYFLGSVPIDSELSRSCDAGESIFALRGAAALSLERIAQNLQEQLESFKILEKGRLNHFDLRPTDRDSVHLAK